MNPISAFQSAASAMKAYGRAVEVIQQNLANASTPGYAREQLTFQALPFNPAGGMLGGVEARVVGNARSEYSESAVWSAVADEGKNDAILASLHPVEPYLDVSSSATPFGSVRELFSAFAHWSSGPENAEQRSAVVTAAQAMVSGFNSAADQLEWIRNQIDTSLRSSVADGNRLLEQIRQYNSTVLRTGSDSSAEANAYAALEDLAAQLPITSRKADDGTISVYLGGQSPLVLGETAYALSAQHAPDPGSPVQYTDAELPDRIVAADGTDVTDIIASGRVKGLLDSQATIASLLGDVHVQGSLNEMARSLADHVNALLTSGQVSVGPPPTSGTPMFSYDPSNPTSVARTIAVVSGFSGRDLAAIDPGPPSDANGIAQKIASLAESKDPSSFLDGYNYTEFAAVVAARVATLISSTQNARAQAQARTEQARSFRSELAGVSLEEEAVKLLAMQRGYEAASRVLKVLDELLQTTISLGQ